MKKLIIILLSISFFSINSKEIKAENLIDAEQDLINKIKIMKKENKKAIFSLVNKDTMRMEGYIKENSYNDYLKVINNDIKTLIVNSGGGDTTNGVKIGLDIFKRKLTVIVEGVAMSSAANYIFLAGQKKIIKMGAVGFHGNTQSSNRKTDFDNLKKELQSKYKITDEDFNQMKNKAFETEKLETNFNNEIGISQKFFDMPQEEVKCLENNLKFELDFFVPSNSTMEKFGIKNIEGQSDINFAEKLGIKVIYF
ncbi:MAG: hypothetical protein U0457_09910 [Candidatus Sericytochromatia bacterium]